MQRYFFSLGLTFVICLNSLSNAIASPPPISEYYGNWRIVSGHSNSNDCKGYPSKSDEASKHIGKILSFGICQNSPTMTLDSVNCDVNSWLYNVVFESDSEQCSAAECRRKELMLFYNGFTYADKTYPVNPPPYGETTHALLGFAYDSAVGGYEVVISKAITEKNSDCWVNTTTWFEVVKVP